MPTRLPMTTKPPRRGIIVPPFIGRFAGIPHFSFLISHSH